MRPRILLDPEAETAGTVTDTKAAPTPATPTPVPTPDPSKVTLDKAGYEADRAELDRLRKEEKDRADAVRKAGEEKAREKGEYDKIIKAREDEIAATQKRADDKDAENRRILTTAAAAFASRDLATALPANLADDDARVQLLALLGPHVEAKMDGDNFVTKSRDGRSVADFVKAELAKPGFAKFLAPTSKGGSGANASAAAPTVTGDDQPQTLGHAMAALNRGGARPGRGNSFGLGSRPASRN